MDRFQKTRNIAVLGISANVLLLFMKLTVGFISRSQAMIADALNSAGDIFASVMTFIGNRISSRPEDEDHPYGHGKAEYIFSMIISFSLILVAIMIFRSAFNSIRFHEEFTFSWWLIGIAVITIVIKASLFIYTRSIGRKMDNLLILANSEDHRNDIFVTSSTLLGIFFGKRIYWLDGAVGIGISIWILFVGGKIFLHAFHVLMDKNIPPNIQKELAQKIESVQGVDHIDDILAKPTGVRYILIVKVSVDKNMSVGEGHAVAARIRAMLKNEKDIGDAIVHINPA